MSTDPYNPYAAPGANDSAGPLPASRARAPGEVIKWLYAAGAALSLAIIIVLLLNKILDLPKPVVEALVKLVDYPLHWLFMIFALMWVHASWSGIPSLARGDTTPGNAVGRFFLPLYNLYWMFAVNLRLCESLDSLLAERDDRRRAPRELSVLAASINMATNVCAYVPEVKSYLWVLQALTHVAWIAFMLSCDPLRRAVAAAKPAR